MPGWAKRPVRQLSFQVSNTAAKRCDVSEQRDVHAHGPRIQFHGSGTPRSFPICLPIDPRHVFPQSAADPTGPLRTPCPGILGAFVQTAADGHWSRGMDCCEARAFLERLWPGTLPAGLWAAWLWAGHSTVPLQSWLASWLEQGREDSRHLNLRVGGLASAPHPHFLRSRRGYHATGTQ